MRTAANSIFSRRQQLRIICMWVAWNISLIASSTWLIFTIPKHSKSSFGQAPMQTKALVSKTPHYKAAL